MTLFVKFRKNFILPVKWMVKRAQTAEDIQVPDGMTILEEIERNTTAWREAQRNLSSDSKRYEGRLEILNWIKDYGISAESKRITRRKNPVRLEQPKR